MIKKIFLSALSVILVLSLGIVTYAKNTTQSTTASQNEVIAVVDDQQITSSYLQLMKKNYDIGTTLKNSFQKSYDIKAENQDTDNIPYDQLLQKLIKDQVIRNECRKNGISVSREEAGQQIKEAERVLENLKQNGTDSDKVTAQRYTEFYNKYAKALGLTYEEYKEKYEIEAEQLLILKNKLYQYYIAHIVPKNTPQNQINVLYQQYLQNLVKNSKVQTNSGLLKSLK